MAGLDDLIRRGVISPDAADVAAQRVRRAAIHERDPSQPRSGLADYAERMGNRAWGDIQDIARHPENIVGAGELGMAKPAAMAIARKAVPWAKSEGMASAGAPRLGGDAQRQLIESLYPEAAGARDERAMSAIARDTHELEKQHGIWLVKDPAERERMGLPPIPAAEPAASAAPAIPSPSEPPRQNWLDILKGR